MKNVRVKVRDRCVGAYDVVICEGRKVLMENPLKEWETEKAAIRNAKTIARRISIKYDPEIIKQHGC